MILHVNLSVLDVNDDSIIVPRWIANNSVISRKMVFQEAAFCTSMCAFKFEMAEILTPESTPESRPRLPWPEAILATAKSELEGGSSNVHPPKDGE